jgi:hypothetical protein
MKRAILFTAFCLVGCAHTPEAVVAQNQQRNAELSRAKRCAAIEIYPNGMSPARAYRVLGPVGVSVESSGVVDGATYRDRKLQDSACALGADAIVDIQDFSLSRQVFVSGEIPARTVDVTGLAVAWAEPARP